MDSTTHDENAVACPRATFRRSRMLAWLAAAMSCLSTATAQTLEQIDFSAQRSQVVAQVESVPDIELRWRHLRCLHVASVRGLTMGETTVCAIVADALRERVFAGDHRAMTTWAESQRDPYLSLLQP